MGKAKRTTRSISIHGYTCNYQFPGHRRKKQDVTIGYIHKDHFTYNHPKTGGLPAIATVVSSQKLMDEFDMSIDGEKISFPLILMREDIRTIGTEDEINALVKHELLHFLKGHEKTLTEEQGEIQHKQIDKEMTKEEIALISNLCGRLIMVNKGVF